MTTPDTSFETHHTINELAEQWHYGRETVRQLVKAEPGVLRLRQGKKRKNITYSIPSSVAVRIHARLTAV
jgi:hypothetical protein